VNGKVLSLPEDDEFAGPTSKRECRDVIFLIIFLAFLGGAWAIFHPQIAFLAFVGLKGDPERLIRGFDQYGNVCGRKNNIKYDAVSNSGQDKSTQPQGGARTDC
ncbi:hypothetical protein SK128_003446, partial [Halocaridina rubra]